MLDSEQGCLLLSQSGCSLFLEPSGSWQWNRTQPVGVETQGLAQQQGLFWGLGTACTWDSDGQEYVSRGGCDTPPHPCPTSHGTLPSWLNSAPSLPASGCPCGFAQAGSSQCLLLNLPVGLVCRVWARQGGLFLTCSKGGQGPETGL